MSVESFRNIGLVALSVAMVLESGTANAGDSASQDTTLQQSQEVDQEAYGQWARERARFQEVNFFPRIAARIRNSRDQLLQNLGYSLLATAIATPAAIATAPAGDHPIIGPGLTCAPEHIGGPAWYNPIIGPISSAATCNSSFLSSGEESDINHPPEPIITVEPGNSSQPFLATQNPPLVEASRVTLPPLKTASADLNPLSPFSFEFPGLQPPTYSSAESDDSASEPLIHTEFYEGIVFFPAVPKSMVVQNFLPIDEDSMDTTLVADNSDSHASIIEEHEGTN